MFPDGSRSSVCLPLLCFALAVDVIGAFCCIFLIFFAQWSDLACSEWLVSPSGDVGLNSRV